MTVRADDNRPDADRADADRPDADRADADGAERHANRFERATRALARSRVGIALLSVGESTIVPIPLETVIVPLMVGYPRRALVIGAMALVGCLLGATIFYLLGSLLFEPVVAPALAALGLTDAFREALAEVSEAEGFWAVFLISVGPLPLQLATLGAGTAGVSYVAFIAAVATSRAIRYLGLALICMVLGERIRRLKLPRWLTVGGTLVLMALSWTLLALLL